MYTPLVTAMSSTKSIFLLLPLEIRQEIYFHIFFPDEGSTSISLIPAKKISPRPEFGNLSILRTNKQVYGEASLVFYEQSTLVIRPYSILCLRSNLQLGKAPETYPQVWKHNPLHQPSRTEDSDGKISYTSPQLRGLLEPHIFERFQHVRVLVLMNQSLLKILMDASTADLVMHAIALDNSEPAVRLLQEAHIMDDLVKLLSNMKGLKSAEVQFGVDLNQWWFCLDATEVFTKSGGLEPLKRLTNVRNLKVNVLGRFELGVEETEILKEVVRVVEGGGRSDV
ncbi:hypothetical protein BGZ60DRAFT_424235 [Tricladium varicosporioides]|nr:hypothetical protein BGZ60DRAFT_424235 [Hymenoscyphus varicosporioides]